MLSIGTTKINITYEVHLMRLTLNIFPQKTKRNLTPTPFSQRYYVQVFGKRYIPPKSSGSKKSQVI